MWDANEEQGGARGILTLMAGGQASEDSQKLVAQKRHEMNSPLIGMVRGRYRNNRCTAAW